MVGKHATALDSASITKINLYITRYEELYLIDLLGVELFNLFKAALPGSQAPPPTGIYLDIYDPIREDDGSCIRISRGMKDMILGFLWWEYTRDAKFKQALTGIMADKSDNSREVTFDEANIYSRYNESIASYDAIQWYINQHSSDYPDYNGQYKGIVHWAL